MAGDFYVYRLCIVKNSLPEPGFDVCSSATPIHADARLSDSRKWQSVIFSAERLHTLLTEALGDADAATKKLRESMTGKQIEMNVVCSIPFQLLSRYGLVGELGKPPKG
jgi:hypothetical protein